jgi:hypothetical protein
LKRVEREIAVAGEAARYAKHEVPVPAVQCFECRSGRLRVADVAGGDELFVATPIEAPHVPIIDVLEPETAPAAPGR